MNFSAFPFEGFAFPSYLKNGLHKSETSRFLYPTRIFFPLFLIIKKRLFICLCRFFSSPFQGSLLSRRLFFCSRCAGCYVIGKWGKLRRRWNASAHHETIQIFVDEQANEIFLMLLLDLLSVISTVNCGWKKWNWKWFIYSNNFFKTRFSDANENLAFYEFLFHYKATRFMFAVMGLTELRERGNEGKRSLIMTFYFSIL